MHAIFFGLKRAHHATLRFARPVLAKVRLTPARFDLLYALFGDPARPRRLFPTPPYVTQASLSGKLGVCRMTVSRMVRSLEELGLLHRQPRGRGGRRLLLQLTPRGEKKVRRILRRLMDRGHIDLVVDSLLAPWVWYVRQRAHEEREHFEGLLRRIREGFGDAAWLRYPWHPED